jgi:hypothetical protein
MTFFMYGEDIDGVTALKRWLENSILHEAEILHCKGGS